LYYTEASQTLSLGFDDNQNIDKLFTMTEENKTVGEQITLALNGFFDKFKTQFNISPKEEAKIEDPEAAQAALFSEFNATINSIEFKAPYNSDQFATLNASIIKLTEANEAQAELVNGMKGEIIELRGAKGGSSPVSDKAPAGEKEPVKTTSVSEDQFNAMGKLFQQRIK
jgi:hypothetical protein